MEVPIEVLERRFGDAMTADTETHQSARVELANCTIEIGFSGRHRMFGSLNDTPWIAIAGTHNEATTEMQYRFDRHRFVVKRGADDALAATLSDDRTKRLARAAELKELTVADNPAGRRVTMIPLPGTITAVYFPPLPPYTVPMKPAEVEAQIDLLQHLLSA
jgi:hypothetical protein